MRTNSVSSTADGAGGGSGPGSSAYSGGNGREYVGAVSLPSGTAYRNIIVGQGGAGDTGTGATGGGGGGGGTANGQLHCSRVTPIPGPPNPKRTSPSVVALGHMREGRSDVVHVQLAFGGPAMKPESSLRSLCHDERSRPLTRR